MSKTNMLTRLELADELGASARTVDRLIASGLAPVGRRGKAKLYDPGDAARLWDAARRKDNESTAVIVESWLARTEDVVDRHRALVQTWIADRQWRPAWADVVEFVRAWFFERPGIVGSMVPWCPEFTWRSLVDSAREQTEKEVDAMLAVDRETLPPRPAPALAERMMSMGDGDELGTRSPEWRGFVLSFSDAEREAVHAYLDRDVDDPMTTAESRQLWLSARSAYTRMRIAVRHGHRKRDELRRELEDAVWTFRHTVLGWLNRPPHGDADTTRKNGERLVNDALQRLARSTAGTTSRSF